MKKSIISILLCAVMAAALSGCSLFSGVTTNALGTYDFTQMTLIQLNEPMEGQDVAIIETNYGTMTAVLYTEYAPNTIQNFKNRVKEGFYNDKPFFAIQEGIYALTGASNEEGTEGVTDDGAYIMNECSVNLWPFKGALLGYSGQAGYSDSRFFFAGAMELGEDDIAELKGYTDTETGAQIIPDTLIKAFTERGSIPGFAGTYTVFGQLINGYDVLDKILWSKVDATTKKPADEVVIKSITLDTYKKGKFELEEPTADKYLTLEEIEKLEAQLNGTETSAASSADSAVSQ